MHKERQEENSTQKERHKQERKNGITTYTGKERKKQIHKEMNTYRNE